MIAGERLPEGEVPLPTVPTAGDVRVAIRQMGERRRDPDRARDERRRTRESPHGEVVRVFFWGGAGITRHEVARYGKSASAPHHRRSRPFTLYGTTAKTDRFAGTHTKIARPIWSSLSVRIGRQPLMILPSLAARSVARRRGRTHTAAGAV